ncbi:hypothetical protein AKI39_19400 [Bordetella sp. H567]|uniref:hypothetical protein n=1 Tax=Bordetella sp. H567 TaxID=1697043 RepID=UPI00081C6DDA|nr:hypothetical protein [Bordetella sp. H567]AOB32423.1 hypothetical protein AKI39_19400 [Bordetella sp. H567]
MIANNTPATSVNSMDRETSNLDASFQDNMNSPAVDIAMAQQFAMLSSNVSYKAACVAGMLKLTVSCCKDIVRIVGT